MSRTGVAITVPNKRPSNGKSPRGGKPARGNAGGAKSARRVEPKRGDVRTIESRTDEERAARAKIAARTEEYRKLFANPFVPAIKAATGH